MLVKGVCDSLDKSQYRMTIHVALLDYDICRFRHEHLNEYTVYFGVWTSCVEPRCTRKQFNANCKDWLYKLQYCSCGVYSALMFELKWTGL